VQRANGENFCYDIAGFQGERLQYTVYEKDQFYSWHQDEGLGSLRRVDYQNHLGKSDGDITRKLSVTLQLSDPGEYEGGELQLFDPGTPGEKLLTAPRDQGTVLVFDSRVPHRVRKVKSGTRRSLVGWVMGPRWR
jgi:PKHD-type hydroxylase